MVADSGMSYRGGVPVILASALADLILMSAMPTSAVIAIADARETTVLRLDRHRVQPDPALFGDLKVLLGSACVAVDRKRRKGRALAAL